jgi:hypothetical protein
MRYPLEIFSALRAAWPREKPIGAKISGTDFAPGGWTVEDAVVYARELKRLGCDYVTLSGGGVVLDAKVPAAPGYQVPYAERVRRDTGITTGSVGLIAGARQAEEIVASGKADFVRSRAGCSTTRAGRGTAAHELGAEVWYPPQYERVHPKAGRARNCLGIEDVGWVDVGNPPRNPLVGDPTAHPPYDVPGLEFVCRAAAIDRLEHHRPPQAR